MKHKGRGEEYQKCTLWMLFKAFHHCATSPPCKTIKSDSVIGLGKPRVGRCICGVVMDGYRETIVLTARQGLLVPSQRVSGRVIHKGHTTIHPFNPKGVLTTGKECVVVVHREQRAPGLLVDRISQ